ncbi:MAG: hypothetical protein KDK44_01765, partial [Chlamydiia bacterium]|nr:hypothetical protein [Chlamydiia bacterium]
MKILAGLLCTLFLTSSTLSAQDSQEKSDYNFAYSGCLEKKKPELGSHQVCPVKAKECPPDPCCKVDPCTGKCIDFNNWSIDLRAAGYFPLIKQHQDIYGTGWASIQMEFAYVFARDVWLKDDKFNVWLHSNWTFRDGETIGFEYFTRVYLFPIAAGIEYFINIADYLDFYIGLAPTYSFVRIKNYDGFSTNHLSSSQFGLMTKTGFHVLVHPNIFLDIFGDYFFTRFGDLNGSIQNIDQTFSGFYVG